jgi:hypothetical protein
MVASKLKDVQIFIAADSTKHFTQFSSPLLHPPTPLEGVSVAVMLHHTISSVDGC